jgi:hypothetical protein
LRLIRYLGTGALDPAFNGIVLFSSGYCGDRLAKTASWPLPAGPNLPLPSDGKLDVFLATPAPPTPIGYITECCDVALAADGRLSSRLKQRRVFPDRDLQDSPPQSGWHLRHDVLHRLVGAGRYPVRLATQGDGRFCSPSFRMPNVHRLLENGQIDTSFGQAGGHGFHGCCPRDRA